MNNGGDSLARGAKSAQFSSGGTHKTDLQWDLATLTKAEFIAKHLSTYRGQAEVYYQQLINEQEQNNA